MRRPRHGLTMIEVFRIPLITQRGDLILYLEGELLIKSSQGLFPAVQGWRHSYNSMPLSLVLNVVIYSRPQTGGIQPDGLRIFSYNDEYGNVQDDPSPNPAKRTWEKYAVQEADTNGTPYYQCLWKGESGSPCDYQSEKQAMKRHIEVTHLKIK